MILITGATGNVGREAVNLLLAQGQKVIAISRHAAAARLPSEAQLVEGDPSRPQTVADALKGAADGSNDRPGRRFSSSQFAAAAAGA